MNPHLSLPLLLVILLPLPAMAQTSAAASNHPAHPVPATDYGKLPLSFEANQGQTDSQVRFLSRGHGYSLFLTDSAAVLTLARPEPPAASDYSSPPQKNHAARSINTDAVCMELVGASHPQRVTGAEQLSGTANYFIGRDSTKWHTNIPTYARVSYTGVYPGVDLVYYGNQQHLEYDFILAPGADPKPLRLHFTGAQRLTLDPSGNLTVRAKNGEIAFQKPLVYQEKNGRRQTIDGKFKLLADNSITFTLGAYDHHQTLVIDPTLAYSTYLGGVTPYYTSPSSMAVDPQGNAYVVGYTESDTFPSTPGAFAGPSTSIERGFVTKLNPTGTALVYSAIFGDSTPSHIAVDSSGNAYVTGGASSNFPVTPGSFQAPGGGLFIVKLNPAGTALLYSARLGGDQANGPDGVEGIAVDAAGDLYLAGDTGSTNFPVTPGAFQTQNPDTAGYDYGKSIFVSKLNPTGSALLYSTYLGGSTQDYGNGIAIDDSGDAYVTGVSGSSDFPVTSGVFQTTAKTFNGSAFVAKLNPQGTGLIYATYLGGSGGDSGNAIAIDSSGDAYVAGSTASTDFPVTAGAFQSIKRSTGIEETNGFITKLNPDATALIYSTYLGGTYSDSILGMAVNRFGNALVTGYTQSHDFPVTEDAFQSSNGGSEPAGTSNAFVTELAPNGTALDYSTYLGGNGGYSFAFGDYGRAIVLDLAGNAYLTGIASSQNFPTTAGAFQPVDPTGSTDNANAFVSKFVFAKHSVRLETTTQLTANANPVRVGDKITFTAYVRAASGTGTPTGYLRINVDAVTFATVPLNETGQATVTWTARTPGKFRFKARYLGDEVYLPSSSDALSEKVIGPPTRIDAVSSSHQKAIYGSKFAAPLIALVKDIDGTPVSGVKITFSGAGIKFSSATAVTGANGEASVDATAEASGNLTAEASVSGVSAPATFALTATRAQLTVTAKSVSVPVGHAIPTLTSSIAGFVNGDKPTVVTGDAREVTHARQGSPAGVYTIEIGKGTLEASDYTFNFVDGTLTITSSTP
ncbi:SBBP repeat-containing protein [Tunturiibacter gelidoferens]|uniref:SBBP repeat-containing protein n=1 Tax=Tunturiibacter gelidiferens TaxID=3069689 RepID=A0AAU7YX63_9BACT